MTKVVLIGTGNVAKHLFEAFLTHKNILVVQVAGRNKKNLTYFEKHTKTTQNLEALEIANIYIIAISDDSISSVSQYLNNVNGLLVHTSGSVPLGALPANTRRGVFYPLQTFSEGKKVDFSHLPICIEAESGNDLLLLHKLASALSDQVYEIASAQRRGLHLAAIFVNNFTNHLYQIGNEICQENALPFDLLKPLIKETAEKIETLSPYEAQSGPAKRNDTKTIKNHLQLLKNKNQKNIYTLLSRSIYETYGKKL